MRYIRGSLEHLQPLIDVSVAAFGSPHRETVRALIDTGATRTCLTSRLIDRLALPAKSKMLVSSATSAPERRRAYAYSLGLFPTDDDGSARTLYVLSYEFVAPPFYDNDSFDVLLGMDILSQGTLTLLFDGTFSFAFDF